MPAPAAVIELLEEAQRLGFLGPGPVDEHVAHARGMATALSAAAGARFPLHGSGWRVVDLGSGGGVPGLPLALEWTEARFWFLEAGHRRSEFLRRAVRALGLEARVEVVNARAEIAGRGPLRGTADVVTARSFGPPAVVAECGAPLLQQGGLLVVSEPPSGNAGPPRWPPEALAEFGLRPQATPSSAGGATYRILHQVSLCPDVFPRRTGVPAKRPRF